MMRLLLILAFALQPTSMLVSAAPDVGMESCEMPACCRVVESVDCCGEQVLEVICGESGGECNCVASPADTDPVPVRPLPSDGSRIMLVVESTQWWPALDDECRASLPSGWSDIHLSSLSSHNRTQALLGIWQT